MLLELLNWYSIRFIFMKSDKVYLSHTRSMHEIQLNQMIPLPQCFALEKEQECFKK